jgi:hypothetical protein
MTELLSTVTGARAADVRVGAGEGGGGTGTVVRGAGLVAGAEDGADDGADVDGAADVDGTVEDGWAEGDAGAGAAPDGVWSPPWSATTPKISNAIPASATTTPASRALPGAASAERSRATGGLPPDEYAVPVDGARISPSGGSPEPPVRSSNVKRPIGAS